jgi:hypothetical protein
MRGYCLLLVVLLLALVLLFLFISAPDNTSAKWSPDPTNTVRVPPPAWPTNTVRPTPPTWPPPTPTPIFQPEQDWVIVPIGYGIPTPRGRVR